MFVDNNRCFVLRPFSSEFQNVWDLAIQPAIREVGLDPWDGEKERLGSNMIHRDISAQIWAARLIVADLTSRNPNVMYELGLAHAAKKLVILLLEESEQAPFDIAHIRYLRYKKTHLKDLQNRLIDRIRSTIEMTEETQPDLFPELNILTPEIVEELNHLRGASIPVCINVSPSSADIFFNDKLVGTGSATISVSQRRERNTVSVSAVGFYESHGEIKQEDLARGLISINLEHVYRKDAKIFQRISKRLPAWLRDRRRDPLNPVLMRAISNYLLMTGERADALEEIQELINVAPEWYLAVNQQGFYYGIDGQLDQAIPWYERTTALGSHHYIGFYNLACIFSLENNIDECLKNLRLIAECPSRLQSIRETHHCLSRDSDFRNVIFNEQARNKFRELELHMFPDSPEPEASFEEGVEGYIF
jgi:tetratricopeptide (TPR) repeat protein